MLKAKEVPLGIRLNNPGCMRITKDRWQGLDPAETARNGKYFAFLEAVYGLRAIARALITYQDKRLAANGSKIDTVKEIVERWAPPSENPTEHYIDFVRSRTGIYAGQHLDLHDFATTKAIVCAIVEFENGCQPYDDATITKALVLAGLEPEKAPIAKSRTMKGGVVAMAATGLAAVGEAAKDAAPVVEEWYRPALDMIGGLGVPQWAFLGIAAAGIAVILYARWHDAKRGLR